MIRKVTIAVIMVGLFLGSGIFAEDLIKAKNYDGTYCFINNSGEVLLEGAYEDAYNFSEGLARVQIDGKFVFIDETGTVVINLLNPDKDYDDISDDDFSFEIMGDFHNGLALCKIKCYNKKIDGFGYINKKGELVISKYASFAGGETYNQFSDFSEGFAFIKMLSSADSYVDKWGFIDTKGEWLVKPSFEQVSSFSDGMARIMYPNTNKWGYINTEGKTVIRPKYPNNISRFQTAFDFSDGLALVLYDPGNFNFGFIDKEGNLIIDITQYYSESKNETCLWNVCDANSFSDGVAILRIGKNNGKLIIINQEGEILADNLYYYQEDPSKEATWPFNTYESYSQFSHGVAFISTSFSGWGIINKQGEFVVEPQDNWYPEDFFYNGLAKVKDKTENNLYINSNGDIVYSE